MTLASRPRTGDEIVGQLSHEAPTIYRSILATPSSPGPERMNFLRAAAIGLLHAVTSRRRLARPRFRRRPDRLSGRNNVLGAAERRIVGGYGSEMSYIREANELRTIFAVRLKLCLGRFNEPRVYFAGMSVV